MINQRLYPPPLKDTDFTVSAVASLGLWRGQVVLVYTTSQKRIRRLKNSIAGCLMTLARNYLSRDLTGSEKQELMKTCEENIEFAIRHRLKECYYRPMIVLDDLPTSKQEPCLMDKILNTSTKQQ